MRETFSIRQTRTIQNHLRVSTRLTDADDSNPRTPLQFYKSTMFYLRWRSGREWRPLSHRYLSESYC
jgi:hypothetical protein